MLVIHASAGSKTAALLLDRGELVVYCPNLFHSSAIEDTCSLPSEISS